MIQILDGRLFSRGIKAMEHPEGLLHKDWFLSKRAYYESAVNSLEFNHTRVGWVESSSTAAPGIADAVKKASFPFRFSLFRYRRAQLYTCEVGGVMSVFEDYLYALQLTDHAIAWAESRSGPAVFTADGNRPNGLENVAAIVACMDPLSQESLACLLSAAAQN